jgi:uncharacterized protein YdaU (DUF1376 family)
MKAGKIRYVSFEPGAILNDPDFVVMRYDDKGTYLLLLMHLYQNEGVLPFDFAFLRKICGRRIENSWRRIKHKFKTGGGKLTIGWVCQDVERAKNLSQVQSAKAFKRWGNEKRGDAAAMPSEAKRSEDKRSEEKRNEAQQGVNGDTAIKVRLSVSQLAEKLASHSISSNGSSPRLASPTAGTIPKDLTMRIVNFHDELCRIFPKRTPSDSSSIRNLANWVRDRIRLGLFQDKIIGNILAIARDSKKGKSRKPIAVFYAQLKTDLGYKQNE